jgi:hypothetical protein
MQPPTDDATFFRTNPHRRYRLRPAAKAEYISDGLRNLHPRTTNITSARARLARAFDHYAENALYVPALLIRAMTPGRRLKVHIIIDALEFDPAADDDAIARLIRDNLREPGLRYFSTVTLDQYIDDLIGEETSERLEALQ